MAFKDVLLALTTYREPTPVTAVDQAVMFAEALGARISAIACEVKVKPPGRIDFLADALLDIPAMVAAELQKSAANAQSLLAAFQEAAEKRGVFQEKILERCLTSEVAEMFVEYARLRDMTIIPVPEGDFIDQWYAEAVIFGSGRPTVVMPHVTRRPPSLGTVVVAWDFSRPAARAVWDAMPILQKAKIVRVVTVTSEKVIDSRRSGAELAKYLSRHGVTVDLETVDVGGRKIGDALRTYVEARDADLLVMGAYGHSKIRQFILGGATLGMLSRPPLPILLSH